MKLPRSIPGMELAALLRSYGYTVTRQTGSHMRLTSTVMGREHHISVPRHDPLKVGTLGEILADVAAYVGRDRAAIMEDIFG